MVLIFSKKMILNENNFKYCFCEDNIFSAYKPIQHFFHLANISANLENLSFRRNSAQDLEQERFLEALSYQGNGLLDLCRHKLLKKFDRPVGDVVKDTANDAGGRGCDSRAG